MRFLLLALLFLYPATLLADSRVAPHRALYRMTLESARTGSNISHVEGTMLFDWSDACDGWAIQQRMKLHFSQGEGEESSIDSAVVTWESKSGAQYNFNVRRTVNGDPEENFKGRAALDEKGAGRADYVFPKDKEAVLLPNETVFPSAHTKMILAKAAAGETFFSRRVFDGSDEAGYADVSAFIGAKIEDLPKGAVSAEVKDNALLDSPAWPVRLAFFEPNPEMGLPDYEMDLVLQENGVARSMHIDYGDFSVKGELASLEPVKSACP